jgi:hypothetical protein
MGLANQAYVSRDWNTAIQLCRGIITRQPWSPEPYTTRAMVYKEMGDEKNAMDGFAQLIAIAPEPRVLYVWLG